MFEWLTPELWWIPLLVGLIGGTGIFGVWKAFIDRKPNLLEKGTARLDKVADRLESQLESALERLDNERMNRTKLEKILISLKTDLNDARLLFRTVQVELESNPDETAIKTIIKKIDDWCDEYDRKHTG